MEEELRQDRSKQDKLHIFVGQKCGFPTVLVRQVGRNRRRSSHFQQVSVRTNFRAVGERVLECECALGSLQYPFRLGDPEG